VVGYARSIDLCTLEGGGHLISTLWAPLRSGDVALWEVELERGPELICKHEIATGVYCDAPSLVTTLLTTIVTLELVYWLL